MESSRTLQPELYDRKNVCMPLPNPLSVVLVYQDPYEFGFNPRFVQTPLKPGVHRPWMNTSIPELPALHWQTLLTAARCGCAEFSIQGVQSADPGLGLNVDTGHAEHVPPLVPVCPALHTQLVETELPAGELADAGQLVHALAAVAPTVARYVSAVQLVQTAGPGAVLNLPTAHARHAPPSGPVKPALHAQAVWTVLALGEWELAGQAWHVPDMYCPAGHGSGTHGPPAVPVKPALHVHALATVLPCGDIEFAGQAVHGAGVGFTAVGASDRQTPSLKEDPLPILLAQL